MKNFRFAGIILISVFVLFYLIYLLILPNVINLSFAKDLAKKAAKDMASVNLDIGNIKLRTGFPLNAGVVVDNIGLVCANGSKPIVIGEVSARVNLFPLLFKKIQIKDVLADDILISTEVDKFGKYTIEQCFVFPENTETASAENTVPIPFVLDEKLPFVKVKNMKLSLKDLETNHSLALNIADFKFDDAILNKKFKIATTGKLLLDDKENINFDIKLDSFMPQLSFESSEKTTAQPIEYFNFIKEFAKYNFLADIKSDLKVLQKDNKVILNGFANIDGLSFKIDNAQLPASYLHSEFDNKENKIDSRIYLSSGENFSLVSILKNSDKFDFEAKFITDKISFKSIQKIAVALMNTFNIPNHFESLKTDGYIISNLSFKTDSNSFVSDGAFRIADGEVSLSDIGLFIKEINSNIDFQNNALQINKTSALVNGALFDVKGSISSEAVTDITVSANKLPVAKLFEAFLTGDLKKNYEIKNGLLDLKMLIKGKLNSIKPSIDVSLVSFELLDKINKMNFSNANTFVNIKTDGVDFTGDIVSQDTKIELKDMGLKLLVPKLDVDILPKEIKINETDILFNNSKLYLSGLVSDYLVTPNIDIKLNGDLLAQDIKDLLPADIVANTTAKGKLPILLSLKGAKDFNGNILLVANKDNYFDIIKSRNLLDKNTAFVAALKFSGADILIDAGIFTSKKIDKTRWKSDEQYLTITGSLVNNGQVFKNLKVITEDALDVSALGISTDVRTELTIDGNITNPQIKGFINLSKINAPDYLMTAQMVNANITPAIINADVLGLDLNGSIIDAKILAPTSFEMPFMVSSVEAESSFIDLDKILEITTKFPQPATNSNANLSTTNAPMIPVIVQKGIAKLGGFKVGTLGTDAVAANFNLKDDILKISNLKGKAYKGDLSGSVDYNLKTLKMDAKLQGENMDANPAVTALLAIKDQIMGTLKFDADFSFKGATLEEQLKTMTGTANFEVKDGQLGSLGRFETYLGAANIVSSKFVQSSVSNVINTVLPHNSGQIALAIGNLSFNKGNVYFDKLETSGKEMALKVSGFLNMLDYNGSIQVNGRLNQEIVNILGPLSDISVDKVLAFIPKVGASASAMFASFNTKASDVDISAIPALTPDASSKTFKVVMQGNLMSPNAVKSFQWLATEEIIKNTESSISNEVNVPDVSGSVEQVKANIQTQAQEKIKQTQEKINQSIEGNTTLKKLQTFKEFLQTTQTEQQE